MDLIEYLEQLPQLTLSSLYDSPYTCQAVLRQLPPLAKQYVLRMLFLDAGVPQGLVDTWALPTATNKHEAAMMKLERLQLLTRLAAGHGEVSFVLHQQFQQQLRAAVCTGMSFQRQPVPDTVLRAAPSKEEADSHAMGQWERLLLYVVGSAAQPPAVPQQLVRGSQHAALDVGLLVAAAGLVLTDGRGRRTGVSEGGFQFLLMDTYAQLWKLLRQYILDMEQSSSAELSSAISFLLQLGAQGQRPLQFARLPPLEQRIATHMAQLGLLLPFSTGGALWLQPTRLASLLAAKSGVGRGTGEGFVIVETNYRVYAYTTSPVQQSILRLFVRCDALLPNLFVGTLNRESVKSALEVGISADQIVGYLRQHAHPRVATKVPIVPLVVAEQIQLWQAELRRLTQAPATMYSNFETEALYKGTAQFAQQLGAVLYKNDETRQLVVRQDAHDSVRAQIRALKQRMGV